VISSRLDAAVLELKKEITSLDTGRKSLHTKESGLVRSIGLYQQRIENMHRTSVRFLAITLTSILSPSMDPRMVGTLFGSARLDHMATHASY
jgi:hypothetical protein